MTRALLLALLVAAGPAAAQQSVGYIDSDEVLPRMPEFQTAQQEIDRLVARWEEEIEETRLEAEALADRFAARELLYTDDERAEARAAIDAKRSELAALRARYFGPEGELFREQQTRLRPAQERLLAAVELVAEDGGYDYVFDRAGDYVFLYTRPRHDLTDRVLEELGVGLGAAGTTRAPR